MDGIVTVVVIVIGVLAALSFVVGLLRKFSRVSWFSVQFALLFGLVALLGLFPDGAGGFWGSLILFMIGLAAVVIGLDFLHTFLGRIFAQTDSFALKLVDRLLGGLMATLNFAVLLVVILGIAPLLEAFNVFSLSNFGGIGEFLSHYAFDFPLIAFFLIATKCGYRVGLVKSVWTILIVVLTFIAFFGAILMTMFVPFMQAPANALTNALLGGAMAGNGLGALIVGYGIVSFLLFLVFFAVIIVISWALSLLSRKLDGVAVLARIDGFIMFALMFVLCLLVSLLFMAIVHMVADGEFARNIAEMIGSVTGGETGALDGITAVFEKIGNAFTSSPLTKFFYENNFFRFG